MKPREEGLGELQTPDEVMSLKEGAPQKRVLKEVEMSACSSVCRYAC